MLLWIKRINASITIVLCVVLARQEVMECMLRRRRRVLQGQMFADNGTISGGGTTVRTGKMRVGNAPPVTRDPAALRAEIEAAEARAAAAEAALAAANDALTRATAEGAAAKERVATGGLAVRKGELEVKSDAAKRKELEGQLSGLRAKAQVCALSRAA